MEKWRAQGVEEPAAVHPIKCLSNMQHGNLSVGSRAEVIHILGYYESGAIACQRFAWRVLKNQDHVED